MIQNSRKNSKFKFKNPQSSGKKIKTWAIKLKSKLKHKTQGLGKFVWSSCRRQVQIRGWYHMHHWPKSLDIFRPWDAAASDGSNLCSWSARILLSRRSGLLLWSAWKRSTLSTLSSRNTSTQRNASWWTATTSLLQGDQIVNKKNDFLLAKK